MTYRFRVKTERDLVKTKVATKTLEYTKFSRPDAVVKETKVN